MLATHRPLRLLLAAGQYPAGFPNRWGMSFGITVCAACERSWTVAQHRAEWGGYGDDMLREIPRWVERWPCRHLLALAASFPDGERWRRELRDRTALTGEAG